MKHERKNFKITVTWWYNEKGQHAFTTIYCDEEMIDAVLFHYTNIEVKEIKSVLQRPWPYYAR